MTLLTINRPHLNFSSINLFKGSLMKKFMACSMLLLTFSTYAQEDLSKAKEMMNQGLDARIANLQNAKSCVSAASTKEALKACHKQLKESQSESKEKMQGIRKTRREERKAKKSN